MSRFFEEYKILGKIGEGSFSDVLKVQHIRSKIHFAAKRLKRIYNSEKEVLSAAEVDAAKRLETHPNVVTTYDIVCDPLPGYVTLILELMDMSLFDYIEHRTRNLSEVKVKNFLYQLVSGVDHLHNNELFHRDIKPENILIKFPKRSHLGNRMTEIVKLADLGSVCCMYSSPPFTPYISTRWYRAPECLLTIGYYGSKMDIWSLGCVFYELLTFIPLFPGRNELDQLRKIHEIIGSPTEKVLSKFKKRTAAYSFPKKSPIGFHNLLPYLSDKGLDLLSKTLRYVPDCRIDIRSLKKHPYFDEFQKVRRNFSEIISPGIAVHQFGPGPCKLSSVACTSRTLNLNSRSKFVNPTPTSKKPAQSLEMFSHLRNSSSGNQQQFMKRRERIWGMNPGAAKNALLKNVRSRHI